MDQRTAPEGKICAWHSTFPSVRAKLQSKLGFKGCDYASIEASGNQQENPGLIATATVQCYQIIIEIQQNNTTVAETYLHKICEASSVFF